MDNKEVNIEKIIEYIKKNLFYEDGLIVGKPYVTVDDFIKDMIKYINK
jgi:hypothetical protein